MRDINQLLSSFQNIIEERKGQNIKLIDLHNKSSVADYLIVVSGTSQRHIAGIADRLYEKHKHDMPMKVEGVEANSGWVLVDAADIIVHLFLPEVREHYNIESLWQEDFFKQHQRVTRH